MLISVELRQFESDGLLKGDISAERQAELITGSSNLEDCVKVSWKGLAGVGNLVLVTFKETLSFNFTYN